MVSVHQPIAAAAPGTDNPATDLAPDLASALAAAPYLPSRKLEGWSAPRQRQFLELIAVGHSVEAAARDVGLSHQSAYAFRASARGAVFALGWRAALLLARDRLADTLLARAFEGQIVTITRADGSVVERHFHDNRLAMAALTRLDRMADAGPASPGAASLHAARLAAQEWDGFLDLIEGERGPARAALFLARRSGGGEGVHALEPIAALARADLRLRTGEGDAADLAIADLDCAARANWTAEQWARAEAAGLLRLAPPPPPSPPEPPKPQPPQHSQVEEYREPGPDDGVWWDEAVQGWQTQFPPPPGFDGEADGDPGDEDYRRGLSPDEAAMLDEMHRLQLAGAVDSGTIDRDRWFAELAEDIAALRAALAGPREGEAGSAGQGEGEATAGSAGDELTETSRSC